MSDTVKRYCLGDDIYVREIAQGNWVRHSDYAALEAEAKDLRASLERIHKAADQGSADPIQFRVLIRAECRNALARKTQP